MLFLTIISQQINEDINLMTIKKNIEKRELKKKVSENSSIGIISMKSLIDERDRWGLGGGNKRMK